MGSLTNGEDIDEELPRVYRGDGSLEPMLHGGDDRVITVLGEDSVSGIDKLSTEHTATGQYTVVSNRKL